MTDLIPFEYHGHQFRYFVELNGEPLFHHGDVCAQLEHSNPSMAIRLVEDADKSKIDMRTFSAGQSALKFAEGVNTEAWFITESGLYDLIMASKAKGAKAFRRWITHEVLPAIRKTGHYSVNQLDRRTLAQMVIEAEDARLAAEQKVAVLEPSAQAWDDLVDTGTTLDVAAAAKKLCENGIVTGQKRLYAYMRSIRWVYQRSTQPRQEPVDAGWLVVDWGKKFTNLRTGEEQQGAAKTRVTAKGLVELQRRLALPQIGPVAS